MVGEIFHSFSLFTDLQVSTIAIVSMVAFFGAVSKAPISTIIMGSEMTGGYALLPAMIVASVISYGLIGLKTSIYKSQVKDRTESPAHRHEYHHLLKKLSAGDALNINFNKISNEATVEEAIQIIKNSGSDNIVIVNQDNKYIGFADLNSLMKLNNPDTSTMKVVPTVATAPTIDIRNSLYDVIKKISNSKIIELPVIDHKDIVLGTISMVGVMNAYDLKLASLEDDDEGKK